MKKNILTLGFFSLTLGALIFLAGCKNDSEQEYGSIRVVNNAATYTINSIIITNNSGDEIIKSYDTPLPVGEEITISGIPARKLYRVSITITIGTISPIGGIRVDANQIKTVRFTGNQLVVD
jgi:hypothetical protein